MISNLRCELTEKRFFKKVDKTDYCWNWKGKLGPTGYGTFFHNGKYYRVHRFSFFFFNGKMPLNNVLHRCDNPKCVNPEHLYDGDQKDNMRDMLERERHHSFKITHCPSGHEYNLKNTRIRKTGGLRRCRECDKVRCLKQKQLNLDKYGLSTTVSVQKLVKVIDQLSKSENLLRQLQSGNPNGESSASAIEEYFKQKNG